MQQGHGNDPINDLKVNLKYETVTKQTSAAYEDFVHVYITERYNTSSAQNTTEIDAIRHQLLLLRSTVKHSNRVSNIDKISLTGLISKYATRLYTVHRINSASKIPDIRDFC